MSMSERGLEEMRRVANEAYSQPVAARYERTLAKYLLSAVDEVRRFHAEVAKLRIQLRDESYLADELEQKNAELRERVGALEGALQKIAKGALGVETDGTFVQSHKVAHAALSQANAQAKLGGARGRSEEEKP